MPLADVTTAPLTAPPDASVRDVARLMREHDAGEVVLVRDDSAVAIVTDRDLALAVVAEDPAGDAVALRHASSPVVAIERDAEIAVAADRMRRYGCRRLVVVDEGAPVGLVALDDLAAAAGDAAPMRRSA